MYVPNFILLYLFSTKDVWRGYKVLHNKRKTVFITQNGVKWLFKTWAPMKKGLFPFFGINAVFALS